MLTKNGLEQIKATVAYQVAHKQALLVSMRINSDLSHKRLRAINELELFVDHGIVLKNSLTDYSKLYLVGSDKVNKEAVKGAKAMHLAALGSEMKDNFLEPVRLKSTARGNATARFKKNATQLNPKIKPYAALRILKDLKIRLCYNACTAISKYT